MTDRTDVVTDIYEALNDANVRIEKLFWLPGVAACSSPPQDFIDSCDEIDARDVKEINLRALSNAYAEIVRNVDDDLAECFVDHLIVDRTAGFLVQLATPISFNLNTHGGYSFSWGYYTTAWRYVPRLDSIVTVAADWARERHDADQKREASRTTPVSDGKTEGAS